MGTTQTMAAGRGPAHRRTPTLGWSRLVRSAVLGGSSLLLAGLAHTLGGGHLPGPAVLTGTAVLLGLVATTATARRCRFPLLLALLGLEQVLLHLWLTAAAEAGTICTGGPAGAGGGHDGHAMLGGGCLAAGSPAPGGMGHGWGMWLVHAGAVVLTAWLLARGEAWWWQAVDRIVRAAEPPVRPAEVSPQAVRVAVLGRPGRAELSPAAPRGPPVLIAR